MDAKISFSEFCDKAKAEYFGYASQYSYMQGLVKALRIDRKYSDDHLKAVYNGSKTFNSNLKRHFPRPVDRTALYNFYYSKIKDDTLPVMADSFGVKASLPRKKEYMASALADQVKAFVESYTDDTEPIVPKSYERAMVTQETTGFSFVGARYGGDGLWVEEKDRDHNVHCYSVFQHQWVIHNTGTCDWIDRKLVLVNKAEVPASFSPEIVAVPYTPHNKIARVSVNVDVHQYDDKYTAYWMMIDSDGKDCFPGSMNKSMFAVRFDVSFNPNVIRKVVADE